MEKIRKRRINHPLPYKTVGTRGPNKFYQSVPEYINVYFYILPLGNSGNAFLRSFKTGTLQYFFTIEIDLRQFLLQQSSSVSHSVSTNLHVLTLLLLGFCIWLGMTCFSVLLLMLLVSWLLFSKQLTPEKLAPIIILKQKHCRL